MFDDRKIYFANDPAVLALASYSTLAHWRSEGRGPCYIKIGRQSRLFAAPTSILWLESRTVQPKAA